MSVARTYTVDELAALRHAVASKWLYGRYLPKPGTQSRQYQIADMAVCVEELVRTHMQAGHTAADLRASEEPAKLKIAA